MNTNSPNEIRFISEMDTLIPLMFDSDIVRPEQMILDRMESLTKMFADDFADVAALPDDRVIGFHIIKKGDFFGRKVGNVSTLWVDPQFRRKGIARSLKQRAEVWARQENLYCLFSGTYSINEPMLKLNAEMGFEIISHRLQKKL